MFIIDSLHLLCTYWHPSNLLGGRAAESKGVFFFDEKNNILLDSSRHLHKFQVLWTFFRGDWFSYLPQLLSSPVLMRTRILPCPLCRPLETQSTRRNIKKGRAKEFVKKVQKPRTNSLELLLLLAVSSTSPTFICTSVHFHRYYRRGVFFFLSSNNLFRATWKNSGRALELKLDIKVFSSSSPSSHSSTSPPNLIPLLTAVTLLIHLLFSVFPSK